MRTHTPSAVSRIPSTTTSAPAERRSRARLRDLCDEVLASYRAASSREVISEQERAESYDLLARIAPLAHR